MKTSTAIDTLSRIRDTFGDIEMADALPPTAVLAHEFALAEKAGSRAARDCAGRRLRRRLATQPPRLATLALALTLDSPALVSDILHAHGADAYIPDDPLTPLSAHLPTAQVTHAASPSLLALLAHHGLLRAVDAPEVLLCAVGADSEIILDIAHGLGEGLDAPLDVVDLNGIVRDIGPRLAPRLIDAVRARLDPPRAPFARLGVKCAALLAVLGHDPTAWTPTPSPAVAEIGRMTRSAHGRLHIAHLEPDPGTLLGRCDTASFLGVHTGWEPGTPAASAA